MVVYEKISDTLVKAHSDQGMMIQKDGTEDLYEEAIDPVSTGRTYTETDQPVSSENEKGPDEEEANDK